MNTDHRKFTIGRDPHSDISIADETVSSRHATLSFLSGGLVTITDCESRNGTYHLVPHGRETRIHHAQLSSSDSLRFGKVVLTARQIIDTLHYKYPQHFRTELQNNNQDHHQDQDNHNHNDNENEKEKEEYRNRHQDQKILYAGFWKRALASIIDGTILYASQAVLLSWFLFNELESGSLENLFFVFSLLLGWLYSALTECSAKQATIGKMVLGIQVTDLSGRRIGFGQATGRFFGKYISAAILFIGFFMAAFTEKKQALHDMMARCLVVNKNQTRDALHLT